MVCVIFLLKLHLDVSKDGEIETVNPPGVYYDIYG